MELWRPVVAGRDAVLAERVLAAARVVVGIYGTWQLAWDPGDLSPSVLTVLWAAVVVYGLCGVGLLLHLRRPRATSLTPLMLSTFVLDAVALVGFGLLSATDPVDLTFIASIAIPVLGGLKFGLAGVGLGMVVLVGEEVARIAVRSSIGARPNAGQVIFILMLGLLVGGVTGWLAQLTGRSRDAAAEQAAQLARTTAEYEALLRVLRAGIEVGETQVAARVLAEIQPAFGGDVPIAAVLSDPDTGELESVRFGSGRSAEVSDLGLLLEADGPAARAIRTGVGQLPSTDEVARLVHGLEGARSEMVAPMRSHGRVLGCLIAESVDVDAFDVDDLDHLQQLADQTAIILDAARSLEHETELTDRFRELDRMKTDFVAITSHELRTPLTAIIGFVETMQRTDVEVPTAAKDGMVDAIGRQARRLARLVDDLRTVSALDAGTLAVLPEEVELDRLVEDVLEVLGGDDVHAAGPPGLRLEADAYRLSQILTNLVRNAREHGAPPIDIGWHDDPDGRITITVTDHGRGIPAAERANVFDRFVQLGPADRHQHGSGLGLAISRELASAMGGELTLEDSDAGARFSLRLSRTSAPPAPAVR